MLDETSMRGRIRSKCRQIGGQAAWARELGVSRAFVGQVINGERAPTREMLMSLGLRAVTLYAEIEAA